MQISPGARQIIRQLQTSGFAAYLVGGCVRDLLLGKSPLEWDITTSARPEDVSRLFEKTIPTGIAYGTVTVMLPEGQFEVTTFRSDHGYFDGRHPANVSFTSDLHLDLARRDFTINALALNPDTEEVVDDFAGKRDLAAQLIRAVGNPLERFREDGLRPLRACRFAAQLNFKIETATEKAIAQTLEIVKKVALERVHDEIIKILKTEKPSIAFEIMRRTQLLPIFLPELGAGFGVEQPPQYHPYDVYWHSLYACDAAPLDDYRLRLAALLHDIGKPACKVDYTFYNHDRVGTEMAEELLRRLKFSNDDIKFISNLIANHMFDYSSEWSDAAVRRFIRRIGGIENVKPLFALRNADAAAMEQEIGLGYLIDLEKRIQKIIDEENALHICDLAIDGKDVMDALQIAPGPRVGQILNDLLEKVLDQPALNQREKLLALIKEHV
jgi:tRNA nucleotidyltransferase (CCA-adding enzyme)